MLMPALQVRMLGMIKSQRADHQKTSLGITYWWMVPRITTYVAERHLEKDLDVRPVNHVLVSEMFERFENGVYVPKMAAN